MKEKIITPVLRPEKINLKTEIIDDDIGSAFSESWPSLDGMPNIFNRSSIFAGEKASKGKSYIDKEIYSYLKGFQIKYTGPALDKRDYQVFQLCIHAARSSGVDMGKSIRIFPCKWFEILRRTDNSVSRNNLFDSLKKLTCANVYVCKEENGYKEEVSGTLLSMAKRTQLIKSSQNKNDIKWLISVNPYTKDLFVDNMTLLDIHRSAQIKSHLGLWLHDFYSSHSAPIPIELKKLKLLSGSEMSISHFNQSLKEALAKLVEVDFLLDYEIKSLNKTDKILIVNKKYNSPIINGNVIFKGNIKNNNYRNYKEDAIRREGEIRSRVVL